MPGLLVLRFVFFPFFSFYHNILCAPRSFALLPTCLVLLICRNILRGRCNQAVEGRVGVTPHGGCSDACAPFCTLFLLRSFITVVGQMDARGLEDGGKGTRERAATRAREGEGDVRNVLYTARNVRWLSFVLRACGTCPEQSLAACNSPVICTQGGCCGSWSGFSSSNWCNVGGTSPTGRLVACDSNVCYCCFVRTEHCWRRGKHRDDYDTVRS